MYLDLYYFRYIIYVYLIKMTYSDKRINLLILERCHLYCIFYKFYSYIKEVHKLTKISLHLNFIA